MSYVSNNETSVKTAAGEFMLTQRNAGFTDNDGKWIVSQLPELYWSSIGFLRQRRPGALLGIFDTQAEAYAAVAAAAPAPVRDEAVMSMGRVSC